MAFLGLFLSDLQLAHIHPFGATLFPINLKDLKVKLYNALVSNGLEIV